MCNLRIGEDVVTLIDEHNCKKGSIRVIQGIIKSFCGCSEYIYDLGVADTITDSTTIRWCNKCGVICSIAGDNVWYDRDEIAPLQADSEVRDIEEALLEVFQREVFS